MRDFELPKEIQGFTEEAIHEKMLNVAPLNIDVSEGSMFYDHTRPVAMMLDEAINFRLKHTLAVAFVQFAYGDYLEWHGEPIGVDRRPATYSTAILEFRGKEGTRIDRNTLVYTLGDEDEEVIYYRTDDVAVITDGVATVSATALNAGSESRVAPHTLIGVKINGVQVTNPESSIGGFDEEDDESYRLRIMERNQNKPSSGTIDDYKRWAKEVEGVGDYLIVKPLHDGPGTVLVLITDADGGVADEHLIRTVQEYIDPVPGKGEGRAPIGAHVTVGTVSVVPILIKVSIVVEQGHEEELVMKEVEQRIKTNASESSTIIYTQIGAVIAKTPGVYDYHDLFINDSTANVILKEEERPEFEVLINEASS